MCKRKTPGGRTLNVLGRSRIGVALLLVGMGLTGTVLSAAAGQASEPKKKNKTALQSAATGSSSLVTSKGSRETTSGSFSSTYAAESEPSVYRIGVEDELMI